MQLRWTSSGSGLGAVPRAVVPPDRVSGSAGSSLSWSCRPTPVGCAAGDGVGRGAVADESSEDSRSFSGPGEPKVPDPSVVQEKHKATSQVSALVSEYVAPLLELNQSIVCAPFVGAVFLSATTKYLYPDLYCAGMVAPYGTKPLPYLHESRHQHALRRARGSGGRFLNTKKSDNGIPNGKATPKKGESSTPSISMTDA